MPRSPHVLALICSLLVSPGSADSAAQAADTAGGIQDGCHISGEVETGTDAPPPFEAWLEDFKAEVLRCGVSARTIQAAFDGVRPSEKVRRLDRSQPEYSKTFSAYLRTRVTDGLVRIGRDRVRRHRTLLMDLEDKYGVEAEILVALWGLESGFGADIGSIPAITALSTLAHDGRRSAFYRRELLSALRILEDGHREPGRMPSSWAGALGQTQFMPSTFLAHAVDLDGDGRIDLWGSVPDALASAANYLNRLGWNRGQPWAREVLLPAGFDAYQARLDMRAPVDHWDRLGVRLADRRPLPGSDPAGALVLPSGIRGPAFLVYDNFRVLTEWNRSLFYALSVGHLSDRLAGKGPLTGKPPPGDAPLPVRTVESMQEDLNALGYSAGEPDGMVGRQTRQALRDYQRDRGMVADAYPTSDLVARLRAEVRGEDLPALLPRADRGDILAMQRSLERLGYEVGELDGKMGPKTRRAMQAYLRDRGYPQADEPSPNTIQLLLQEGQRIP